MIDASEAVHVENLRRSFGAFTAVDGIDLRVSKGEILFKIIEGFYPFMTLIVN